jgi:hypothetical protein
VLGILTLLAAGCILAGCGEVRLPASPTGPGFPGFSTPGAVLASLALVVTGLAGAGFILCAILAVVSVTKIKFIKLCILCIGVIICSQVLYWIGDHLALAAGLTVAAVVVCGGIWLYLHRRYVVGKIETATGRNLNDNPVIGE